MYFKEQFHFIIISLTLIVVLVDPLHLTKTSELTLIGRRTYPSFSHAPPSVTDVECFSIQPCSVYIYTDCISKVKADVESIINLFTTFAMRKLLY
jgi:hypothetical protein